MNNDMVYNGMLFLHILGAMGYVAALAIIYVSVLGLRHARSIHAVRLWTGTASVVIRTLVPISGIGVTIVGLYLYIVAWRDDGSWVLIGLGAFVLVALVTGGFQGRWLREVASSARGLPDDMPLPPAVMAAAQDSRLVFAANGALAVVAGVLLIMVVKPDLIGSLLVVGCALVLGALLGIVLSRTPHPVPTSERTQTTHIRS